MQRARRLGGTGGRLPRCRRRDISHFLRKVAKSPPSHARARPRCAGSDRDDVGRRRTHRGASACSMLGGLAACEVPSRGRELRDFRDPCTTEVLVTGSMAERRELSVPTDITCAPEPPQCIRTRLDNLRINHGFQGRSLHPTSQSLRGRTKRSGVFRSTRASRQPGSTIVHVCGHGRERPARATHMCCLLPPRHTSIHCGAGDPRIASSPVPLVRHARSARTQKVERPAQIAIHCAWLRVMSSMHPVRLEAGRALVSSGSAVAVAPALAACFWRVLSQNGAAGAARRHSPCRPPL